MQKEAKKFLFDLLETPSPSGFEQKIQKVVKKRMKSYADEIYGDVHGNLIVAFNPDAPVRVMLAGHCDQIGMMTTHIDKRGFLYVNQIGGIDAAVLPGLMVTVHTKDGPVEGVIGFRPVHLTPPPERGRPVDLSKVWIDIGAKDGKAAEKIVSVGDPITFKLGVRELEGKTISSPGCDDKVGTFVVMEALRIVASKVKGKDKKKFPVGVFSVSSVQEELGLRGARTAAYGIDPHVGIAVDVYHATDNPGADPKKVGTIKMGEGAGVVRGANVNPVVEELLVSTAKKKKIPFQVYGIPGATGTDANAIQITRSGVAAGLVTIPNRYMHTPVEMVDLRDLESASKLLAESILRITRRMSFIP